MATRMNIPVWSPERPALALANLTRGDAAGVARSLFSPDRLTPEQHKDLVEQWFGPGESFPKSVARFLTNPMTLVALALARRWGPNSIEALRQTTKSLANYDRVFPGIMRKLSGLYELFHGTGIDDAFQVATRERAAVHNLITAPGLGQGLDDLARATGGLPSLKRQLAMGFHADMRQPDATKQLVQLLNAEAKTYNLSFRATEADVAPLRALAPAEERFLATVQEGTVKPAYGLIEKAHKVGALEDMQRDLLYQSVAVAERSAAKRGAIAGARARKMGLPPQIENYYPRIVMRSPDDVKAGFSDAVREMLPRQTQRAINEGAAARATASSLVARYGKTIPNARQLRVLAEAGEISPKLADMVDAIQIARGSATAGPLLSHDLRIVQALSHYTDSLGRAYVMRAYRDPHGVYRKGLGAYFKHQVGVLATSSNLSNQRNAQLLMDTYLPALMGRSSVEQYSRGLEWGAMKNWTAKMLESPKVRSVVGPKVADRLTEMLHYGTGFATWHQAGGKIASWFYLTTLGFNPATAAQNLFQSILTTGAIVPSKHVLGALDETWTGFVKMQKMMRAGATEHEALAKVFPAFAKEGLEVEPLFAEAIHGAKEAMPGLLRAEQAAGSLTRGGRSFAQKALGLFGMTERFNHLWAFNAAHRWAQSAAVPASEWGHVAAKVTRLGQLWAGPFSIPSGLVNVPAPLRQFTTFPAKMLNFLALSAAGGVPNLGPGGLFNPGTLGRAMLGSMAAYEAGRGLLNTDLSSSLLFGAVPDPAARGPFAPLPVVPPTLAVGGAAALDFATGEFNELKRAWPLLVPGGIAAARAVPFVAGAVSPETAEVASGVTGRPRADYENIGPDGRIAVYSSEGSLIGRFSQVEIIRRALGLGGEEAADEAALTKYLVRQRDMIRDYRRRYITATMEQDAEEAERIDLAYQREIGIGPIQVKKSDMRAYTMRKDIGRLERVMETLPPEARPLYANIIGTVMANAGPHMLGVDPQLLARGTARSRRGL